MNIQLPDDIRVTARELVQQSCVTDTCFFVEGCGCAENIARAIHDERERCAQLVIEHFAPDQGGSMDPCAVALLRAIRRVQPVPSADS